MDSGLEQAAQAIREQRSQAGLHAFEEKYAELLPLLRLSKVDYWVESDREPEMALYFADEQNRTYRRRFGLRPDGQVFTAEDGEVDSAALTLQLADAVEAWQQYRKNEHQQTLRALFSSCCLCWAVWFLPRLLPGLETLDYLSIRFMILGCGLVVHVGLIATLLEGRVAFIRSLRWLKHPRAGAVS
jgi:hypothetical protein